MKRGGVVVSYKEDKPLAQKNAQREKPPALVMTEGPEEYFIGAWAELNRDAAVCKVIHNLTLKLPDLLPRRF